MASSIWDMSIPVPNMLGLRNILSNMVLLSYASTFSNLFYDKK